MGRVLRFSNVTEVVATLRFLERHPAASELRAECDKPNKVFAHSRWKRISQLYRRKGRTETPERRPAPSRSQDKALAGTLYRLQTEAIRQGKPRRQMQGLKLTLSRGEVESAGGNYGRFIRALEQVGGTTSIARATDNQKAADSFGWAYAGGA